MAVRRIFSDGPGDRPSGKATTLRRLALSLRRMPVLGSGGTLARRASILVQFLLKYHVLPVITSVFALFPQFKRLPQKKSGRSYLFLENTPVRLTVPGCSLTFSFSKLYLGRRSAEGNLPIFYVQFPSPARSSRYCRTHYGIRPLQLRESHFINSPCSSNA